MQFWNLVLCSFGIWGFRFLNLGFSVVEFEFWMVLESDHVVLESGYTSFGIWSSVFASSFGFRFWNPVLEFDGEFWNLW